MRRVGALVLAVLVLVGCGARGPATTPQDLDVSAMLRALPTPTGFTQSVDVRKADTSAIQFVFAQGTADPDAARNYAAIGFKEAAIRRWTGPAQTTLAVVASRWDEHQTAANVGGGAAEVIPLSRGAIAWTPASLHGARGTRSQPGAPAVTTLSMAIGDLNVFIIATGRTDSAPVERTMDLVRKSLGA